MCGPVQQIVIRQHGIEVPTVHDPPHSGHIRLHGRYANEPRLPRVLHLVVGVQHRAQSIIGGERMGQIAPLWREPVVDMQHVNRLSAQPPQARLDRRTDRAGHIVHLFCSQPHLGGDDHRLLAPVQGTTQDFFGLAMAIAGRHVKKVHPQLQRTVDGPH
ncbi:MAG TPA: hypothetical protein VLQ80_24935 [Candidatus Saccharimonadia bacterium]|nr:hypothetical protein [Candidatus Saccharimonadia bacterium]